MRSSLRIELALIACLTLIGGGLRFAYPSRIAVEHFDEGVYASNYWFGAEDGYEYPMRRFYAPPLLPALIEWIFILFGPSNFGAALPSLILGSLTIPLVWWVGRRWFGPVAGLSSATLAAFSDIHILFSRTALTDVPLCFFLLAAVYFFWEAVARSPAFRRNGPPEGGTTSGVFILTVGVTTGLAWWTKYNGWLPLAIGLAGVIPWAIASCAFDAKRQARSLRTCLFAPAPHLIIWFAVAAIAFVVWLPYLWSLQDTGGYGPIAANHRGYLVGWSGWWESWSQQLDNLGSIEGWLSRLALPLALGMSALAGWVWGLRFTWNDVALNLADQDVVQQMRSVDPMSSPELWETHIRRARRWNSPWGILFGCILLFGTFGRMSPETALWLLTVLGFLQETRAAWLRLLTDKAFSQFFTFGYPFFPPTERQLAVWLLAAWLVGLTLTTPLYVPYPRLTLTWLLAIWLGAGLMFSQWLHPRPSPEYVRISESLRPSYGKFSWLILLVFMGAFVWTARPVALHSPTAWQPHTGLVEIADEIKREADAQTNGGRTGYVVYVYAEPALLFQLRLAGVTHVLPVAHLNFALPDAPPLGVRAFVVTGPHADRSAEFQEQFDGAKPQLTLVQTWDYAPSDVVLLDNRENDHRPQPDGKRPSFPVRLWRVGR